MASYPTFKIELNAVGPHWLHRGIQSIEESYKNLKITQEKFKIGGGGTKIKNCAVGVKVKSITCAIFPKLFTY